MTHKLSTGPSRRIHDQDVNSLEFKCIERGDLTTWLLPHPPIAVGDVVRFFEVGDGGGHTGRCTSPWIAELLDVDGSVRLSMEDPLTDSKAPEPLPESISYAKVLYAARKLIRAFDTQQDLDGPLLALQQAVLPPGPQAAAKLAERYTASACARLLDDMALALREIQDPERQHKGHPYMASALCDAAGDIRMGMWRPKSIWSPPWPLWAVDTRALDSLERYSVYEDQHEAEEALSELESDRAQLRRARRLPLASLSQTMRWAFEGAIEGLNGDPGVFTAAAPFRTFADWDNVIVVPREGAVEAWIAFCELWLDVRVWEVEPDEGGLDEACYTAGVAQAQGSTAKVVLEHFGDGVYTARARIEEDSDDE